jgi:hypothetical protein
MFAALLWLLFNVLLGTIVQQINTYRFVKITWYGDVLLKQQAATEFVVAKNGSVTNILQQLGNIYGISVVDKSTVSHRASEAACSETGQVKLIDACCSCQPTTVTYVLAPC